MYHPAAALRQGSLKQTMLADMCGLPDVLLESRATTRRTGDGRAAADRQRARSGRDRHRARAGRRGRADRGGQPDAEPDAEPDADLVREQVLAAVGSTVETDVEFDENQMQLF